MKSESKKYIMETLAEMVVEDRAGKENRGYSDVFAEFRRSRTYEELFTDETGLWETGPAYISETYDDEIKRA